MRMPSNDKYRDSNMSERVTTCNKCKSGNLATVKVMDPDTAEMHMKAVLKCRDCGHQDEYQVGSNRYHELRRRGMIR